MMSEAQEQCKLIKWADKCVQMKIHPELSMLYAVPNGGRLYIELKVGNNKTSEHQDKWLQNLSRCGYAVKVCYGSTSAKQTIEKYLQLGD